MLNNLSHFLVVILHGHTLDVFLLQSITFAITQVQEGKQCIPRDAQDTTSTMFLVYFQVIATRFFPALFGQLAKEYSGPCRARFRFMRSGGQDDSLPVRFTPQALGFRCANCTSEFETRRAMDCHCKTILPWDWMRRYKQQVCVFSWTCQPEYFIINSSGT
jgi:hypothetical protein